MVGECRRDGGTAAQRQAQERRKRRATDGENGSEILVVADDNGTASSSLRDNVHVRSTLVHDLGHPHDVEARGSQVRHDMAGDVDVSDEFHAADDSSTLRPEVSHAAYLKHSPMSSTSSSGNSSTTCAALLPAARYFRTSETGMRRPRTHACPKQTLGSAVRRLRAGSIILRLPRVKQRRKRPESADEGTDADISVHEHGRRCSFRRRTTRCTRPRPVNAEPLCGPDRRTNCTTPRTHSRREQWPLTIH